MSSKSDIPENTGQEEADKSLDNKATHTDDQSQIKMNFGKEENANTVAEQEFQQRAEAEMKQRAQKGQRLREEMETQRMAERNKQEMEEAQAKEKAKEEQRLLEEAEVRKRAEHEKKLKEETQAKEKVEEEQKVLLEKARAKRQIQEEKRIKKAEASIKFRDEEWIKFKEEADARTPSETTGKKEYTAETDESFEENPQEKNAGPIRKVLVLLLISAFVIAGIWIFSVFNAGTDTPTPVFPTNETTDKENTGVTPATEIDVENQTGIVNDSVTSEPKTNIESREDSFSNLEIGGTFGEGIIFGIDPSGKTGTIAYSQDVEPMTWKNAMNIHEQLGEGWRLPTMDELSEMYESIGPGETNTGQFTDELYWSSTPYDANQARLVRFSDGNTSFHYNKNAEHRKFKVRAVKDLSQ